jgi:hypothetical protein
LDPLIKRHHETAAIINDFSQLSAIGGSERQRLTGKFPTEKLDALVFSERGTASFGTRWSQVQIPATPTKQDQRLSSRVPTVDRMSATNSATETKATPVSSNSKRYEADGGRLIMRGWVMVVSDGAFEFEYWPLFRSEWSLLIFTTGPF